jgi:sugar/nucleoside kinase (ribokinase family)
VPPETPLSELYGFLDPPVDLLITQGADGGLLIRLGPDGPKESLRYLPTATDGESDPTGAGDTFLAALQASILRPAVVGRQRSRYRLDLRFAAAAGSLVVEGPGLDGVPDRAAVLVRRARERIRRAVVPTEVSQVGKVEAP